MTGFSKFLILQTMSVIPAELATIHYGHVGCTSLAALKEIQVNTVIYNFDHPLAYSLLIG